MKLFTSNFLEEVLLTGMRICQAHEALHHPHAAGTLQYTTSIDSLHGAQITGFCCQGRRASALAMPKKAFPSAGQQMTSAQPNYHVQCWASTALSSFPQWKNKFPNFPVSSCICSAKKKLRYLLHSKGLGGRKGLGGPCDTGGVCGVFARGGCAARVHPAAHSTQLREAISQLRAALLSEILTF